MENLDKIYANKIAEEYTQKSERKVVQLKKLDEKVKRPALIFAFTFGIISILIAGIGMSMILTDVISNTVLALVLGIILGILGFSLCGINYLLYNKILNKRKQKYAYEIKTLAKQIIEE